MTLSLLGLLFLFGAVIGSFLNVCAYRIPLGESIVFPGSRCPQCGHAIRWHDNLPIFGWLLLRGRCRDCGTAISVEYPLVETLAALLTVWVGHRFGLTFPAFALMLLGYAFLVLAVIDFHHYILPDVITLPGTAVGLAIAFLPWSAPPLPGWQDALLGAVGGGGFLFAVAWGFEKLTGRQGMGLGDVKLLAMIGAWMGWKALPLAIFGSAVIGTVVGVAWMVVAGRDRRLPIPFGPYLILAAWAHLFYGREIYQWYWRLVYGYG
ncbi:MAG: prepilin peptidase [Magnetococcales bacterium]|nr:prepilin peptidase [Magnetococcales bacterium]